MQGLTDQEMGMVVDSHPDVIIVLEGGKIEMIASRWHEDKIAIVNRDEGRFKIYEEEGMSTMVPEGTVSLPGKGRFRTRK